MQQYTPNQQNLQAMLSNLNIAGLKTKIIFTLVMIMIFRLCAQLPLFGIDGQNLANLAATNNLIGFLDMFSGGAIGNVSIIALGIGPYITASIIMQLLAVIIPHLEQLQKEEGEAGRRKISQYTRIFTIIIAAIQALVFVIYLLKTSRGAIMPDVNVIAFAIGSVVILTAGSAFTMWMAELMTERGIGNGASMLIFCGIISKIPFYGEKTAMLIQEDTSLQLGLLLLLIIFFATMVFIVIMQEAARKVIIVNPRRQVGNKVYGGTNTFIPFKLNPGGVMPIIFAIAILLFPTTVLELFGNANINNEVLRNIIQWLADFLRPSEITYNIIYFLLIFGLTFFYASIIPNLQPKEIATNLKKYGSSIPGIKPGKPTADALDKILSKTTFIGALSLATIALIPSIACNITGITTLQGIGATSLIIMVGVALDFINQVRTNLLPKNYESFLKQ
ncbi:TPA: preprotein translocase subunit SecY [Candidatus Avigastranaerophilus faecigallinarum]|nr:preprotein translocase subunit SecY [Candidatus Avigastranaerophilus faecigallinarum]